MALPQRKIKIRYPSSDGHPMTDYDINCLLMEYTEFVIKTRCADEPTGYVSANLFIYFEEGSVRKRVAPDTFYVKQAPKGLRRNYLLWEERFVPDVAFEILAKTSYRMDPEVKRDIYERIGIPEYYVFDPLRRWLEPPLWAYRLENGRYLETKVDSGEYVSPVLGLRMKVESEWLRFYDAVTGELCLTAEECAERARHTEAELRGLREEIERLRRQIEE